MRSLLEGFFRAVIMENSGLVLLKRLLDLEMTAWCAVQPHQTDQGARQVGQEGPRPVPQQEDGNRGRGRATSTYSCLREVNNGPRHVSLVLMSVRSHMSGHHNKASSAAQWTQAILHVHKIWRLTPHLVLSLDEKHGCRITSHCRARRKLSKRALPGKLSRVDPFSSHA